jgi:hypothetical protein
MPIEGAAHSLTAHLGGRRLGSVTRHATGGLAGHRVYGDRLLLGSGLRLDRALAIGLRGRRLGVGLSL